MRVKGRDCVFLVFIVNFLKLYGVETEDVETRNLRENFLHCLSLNHGVKFDIVELNTYYSISSQSDTENEDSSSDIIGKHQKNRQARFASNRGKLGRLKLKIHPVEDSKALTRKIVETVTNITQPSTVEALKTSLGTEKVTSASIAPVKTRSSDFTGRKRKFWDQIDLEPTFKMETKKAQPGKVVEKTISVENIERRSEPMIAAQDFLAERTVLRKKIFEKSSQQNDETDEHMIMDAKNNGDNGLYQQTPDITKQTMERRVLVKNNDIESMDFTNSRGTTKSVILNGQPLESIEYDNYNLEKYHASGLSSTPKLRRTKTTTRRSSRKSNWRTEGELWDDGVVHKLRFNNFITEISPHHVLEDSAIISDTLPEAEDIGQTGDSTNDDVIKIAQFLSGSRDGDEIDQSDNRNADNTGEDNTITRPRHIHPRNRQGKTRISRLSKDSNEITKVGPLLNELASHSKKLAESWIDYARALLTNSTPTTSDYDAASKHLSRIWKSIVDFADATFAQTMKFSDWIYSALQDYAKELSYFSNKLLGQG